MVNKTDQEVITICEAELIRSQLLSPTEYADIKQLLALAKDGLLHRALSKQVGGEPLAARWMRWAQRVLPVLKEHLEGLKYRDIELSHLIEVAPKEIE